MTAAEATMKHQVQAARDAIRRVLEDYPRISRSMIGIHVRPQIGRVWTDVLEEMIGSGQVIRETRVKENGREIVIHYLAEPVVREVA